MKGAKLMFEIMAMAMVFAGILGFGLMGCM